MNNNNMVFKLISLVENNPPLYDKSNRLYANSAYTEKIWTSISTQLNCESKYNKYSIHIDNSKVILCKKKCIFFLTEVVLKAKWKQVRDTFRTKRNEYKGKAPRSGAGADDIYKPTWKFYSSLQFLDPFLRVRNVSSSLKGTSTGSVATVTRIAETCASSSSEADIGTMPAAATFSDYGTHFIILISCIFGVFIQ